MATFDFNQDIFKPMPAVSASFDIDLDPLIGTTLSWDREFDIPATVDSFDPSLCSPRLYNIYDVTSGAELILNPNFTSDLNSQTSFVNI